MATMQDSPIIRHAPSRRRSSDMVVTIYPGGGFDPERFAISKTELRRFAWAVLADLDPDEASAAAVESAVDLDVIRSETEGLKTPRKNRGARVSRPVENKAYQTTAGSEAHLVLLGFAARPNRTGRTNDIRAGLNNPANAAKTVSALVREGLLIRLNPTPKGGTCVEGVFQVTNRGLAEIARLETARQLEAA